MRDPRGQRACWSEGGARRSWRGPRCSSTSGHKLALIRAAGVLVLVLALAAGLVSYCGRLVSYWLVSYCGLVSYRRLRGVNRHGRGLVDHRRGRSRRLDTHARLERRHRLPRWAVDARPAAPISRVDRVAE